MMSPSITPQQLPQLPRIPPAKMSKSRSRRGIFILHFKFYHLESRQTYVGSSYGTLRSEKFYIVHFGHFWSLFVIAMWSAAQITFASILRRRNSVLIALIAKTIKFLFLRLSRLLYRYHDDFLKQ